MIGDADMDAGSRGGMYCIRRFRVLILDGGRIQKAPGTAFAAETDDLYAEGTDSLCQCTAF